MIKKRGLASGRGLDALLGSIQQAQEEVNQAAVQVDQLGLVELPLEQLTRGLYQPRREIAEEALSELAESIRRHGVMQPIVVRLKKDANAEGPRYEIIAGERRWRAAKQVGLSYIPAIIREIEDEVAIALALIENIQREDLTAIEQAYALQRFHDEFGMSHQEIADTVGKARTTVSNLLRLLSLEDQVKELLDRGDLDMGHARALLSLPGYRQMEIAKQVVAKGLSVRQTEQLVRSVQSPVVTEARNEADHDTVRLVEKISHQLGMLAQIRHGPKGSGKLVIHYSSLDEISAFMERLGIEG